MDTVWIEYGLGTKKVGKEHVILNSFYSAQKVWFRMFVLMVLVVISKKDHFSEVSNWMFFPELFLMVWSYGQFFKNMAKGTVLWKTLLALLIGSIISISLAVLFIVAFLMN